MSINNHFCVWLEGLSGAGKSTIAAALQRQTGGYILDGDDLRQGLNSGLGFSSDDRRENVRRAAHVARILWDAGVSPIVALTTPMQQGRDEAREMFPDGSFIEVWVATPLWICESRDPKGIYSRARKGEINTIVGLDIPFETPVCPDVVIHPGCTVDEAVSHIIKALQPSVSSQQHITQRYVLNA